MWVLKGPQSLEYESCVLQGKAVQPDEESGRRAAAVLSCIVVSKRSYQEGLIGVILQQPDWGFPRLTTELKVGMALWPSTISFPIAQIGLQILFVLIVRSEEHTSELQSLMRISYAVFCLKKKKI